QAQRTERLLGTAVEEKAQLAEELQLLKPKLTEIDGRVAEVHDNVQEMQPRLKDARTKLARCVESKFETDRDIAQLRSALEQVKTEMNEWEKTHEVLVQSVNGDRINSETRFQEFLGFTREQREEKKKVEANSAQLAERLRSIEEKAHDVELRLQDHTEKHQTTGATAQQLRERSEALQKSHEESKERLNKCNVAITDYRVLAAENKENISKLMSILSGPDVLNNLETALTVISKIVEQNKLSVKDLDERTAALFERENKAATKAGQLEDVLSNLTRRAERVESILGLEPLKKDDDEITGGVVFKGGILLTEEQIRHFRDIFDEFDADNSNTISVAELEDVMQRTGLNPPMDIVYAILEAIDVDKSGDIDFDEFCALLTKMLGPDGKVDVERMLQSMYDSMSYDAKTRKAVETVIHHTTELKQHKEQISQDTAKIDDAEVQIAGLHANIGSLEAEIKSLRQGLDLTQEYWRGFSRGLKETKNTVHSDGDEVLPSVSRLRSTLPPLTARPSTAMTLTSGGGYSTSRF
ncbi:unnamed protein product, partial [Effrenium voratum]